MLVIAGVAYFGGSEYIKRARDINDFSIEKSDVNIGQSSEVESILKGKIVHVSDGDTVLLEDSVGGKHRVRLNGIDAPELGQEFGNESKDFLENLVQDKKVTVEVIGIDQYTRILGVIKVGKRDINKAMLENGYAWQYKYNKDKVYTSLVEKAKSKRLNIWSNPDAMDPHTWRKKHK